MRVGRDITAEERRRDVLRAAVHCLAASGYEAVRLRDIAKQAGVSTGLLQHHFDTREELLEQAFQQASTDLLDKWNALAGREDPPWGRIVALVEQVSKHEDVRRHCVTWIEFAAASARHDSLRRSFADIYAAWQQLLRAAVVDGVDAGDFAPVLPVDEIVSIVLAHIDGCELALAADIGVMTGDRVGEQTLDLVRALLSHSIS